MKEAELLNKIEELVEARDAAKKQAEIFKDQKFGAQLEAESSKEQMKEMEEEIKRLTQEISKKDGHLANVE